MKKALKGQTSMFTVEDLPLWSGTPVEVQDTAFNPQPVVAEPEQMSFSVEFFESLDFTGWEEERLVAAYEEAMGLFNQSTGSRLEVIFNRINQALANL